MGRLGRDRPRRGFAEGSGAAITPEEGAYAFEALLRHNRAYSGYARSIGTPWVAAFADRSKFVEMFKSAGQKRFGTGKLRAELEELPLEEWPSRLRRSGLRTNWPDFATQPSIRTDPLSEYGLDSLGNLELRTHIEAETGIRITSSDITTVRGLADHLYAKLAPKEEDAATPA